MRSGALGGMCLALAVCTALQAQDWQRLARIGVLDGPAEYTLGRVAGVTFLGNGNLAVLDALPPRLLIYDGEGRIQRAVGSRGNGPGQLERPAAVTVSDSVIAVYDQAQRRVVRFSQYGDHIETVWFQRQGAPLAGFVALTGSRWIAQTGLDPRPLAGVARRSRQIPGQLLLIHGSVADTLTSFDSGALAWFDRNGGSFGLYRRSFGPSLLLAASGDTLVATVDATSGEVQWWDAGDGRWSPAGVRRLGLEVHEMELETVKDSIVKAHGDRSIDFAGSEKERYFGAAVMDGGGRVWLRLREEREANAFLVVSPDGGDPVRREMPSGFSPMTFSGDVVAGIWVDEVEVNYVDIYRLPEAYRWKPDDDR